MLGQAAALAACALAVYGPLPAFGWKAYQKRRLSQPTRQPQLVLTFDDGPDGRYTEELLDILARYQVPAVFFVVGNKALKYRHVLERMVAEGHVLGIHSLKHSNGLLLTPWAQKKDMLYCRAIMEGHGWPVRYYRPPWGLANLTALYMADKLGYSVLYWSVMAQDWDNANDEEEILRRLEARVHNGAVICLHDSGEGTGGDEGAAAHTLAALEKFIPRMQKRGYQFVLPEEVRR